MASIAALGTTLLLLGSTIHGATPTPFASLTQPNGLAATATMLFATSQLDSNVYSISPSGVVSTYGTIPQANSSHFEIYMVVTPTTFAENNLFACMSDKVYQLPSSGTPPVTPTLFANFNINGSGSALNASLIHCGITFDASGNYGGGLIVTLQNGDVFKVNSSGSATLFSSPAKGLAADITEGPAVAPSSFTPAPGALLVTQENENRIMKIDTTGNATVFSTALADPESGHFVPPIL